MKLYLVAGEASGDSRGVELMRALFPDSTALCHRLIVPPCLPHLMPCLTTH